MVMYIDEFGDLMMAGARSAAPSTQKYKITDPLRLKSTLIQYGKNQKILDRVSSVLAPLYTIADNPAKFPFFPAEMVREDTICRGIGDMFSRDVSGVNIVSISRAIPLGPFSYDERCQERLARELDRGSLMYTRSELLHMRLFGAFGYGFRKEFQRVIYASLWRGLARALTIATRPIAERTGQVLFWPALEKCLFFFLCHSLFGSPKDGEEMQRLEGLLKLTASGILLLGERAVLPGIWTVIAG